MTEQDKVSVQGYMPEIIEAGTYLAHLTKLRLLHGDFGPYAAWIFHPDGYSDDAEPAGFTSISAGRTSKGMEWARRILGKSDATDTKYGKDMKDKRPVVDWGEDELKGKPCRIVVEKKWDEDEEVYKNLVTNVLPPEKQGTSSLRAAQEEASRAAQVNQAEGPEEEDFNDIPF